MLVAKWYTRASRIRIVIAKFDGRWTLPGGPYSIPELIGLVGGLTATLFLIPRLGHPVLTGLIGIIVTASAVVTMRTMPYSPVPFATRIHRIGRLYTQPSSASFADDIVADLVSVVRPQIEILDVISDISTPTSGGEQWAQIFDHQPSAGAGLFS